MDADKSAERYRVLLEINNAIISNLTQESLFHAISEALRTVIRSIERCSTTLRKASSARLR